jgi:hypothetical protein
MYWAELYVTCEKDIYMSVKDFIVDHDEDWNGVF